MSARSEQRRLLDQMRRFIKLKTGYGTVPIPVGNSNLIVLPLNSRWTNYILLEAQTDNLNGLLSYQEIEKVSSQCAAIHGESLCCMRFLQGLVNSSGLLIILGSFFVFMVLLTVLSRLSNDFFLISFFLYIFFVFVLVGTMLGFKYLMTNMLRGKHRRVTAFLGEVNYALRHKGVFWKAGLNLLWIELHLIRISGGDENNIQINLSCAYFDSSTVKSFRPTISGFKVTGAKNTQFDEKRQEEQQKLIIAKVANAEISEKKAQVAPPVAIQPEGNEAMLVDITKEMNLINKL